MGNKASPQSKVNNNNVEYVVSNSFANPFKTKVATSTGRN